MRPSRLEVAAGWALDGLSTTYPHPAEGTWRGQRPDRAQSPQRALEQLLVPALSRPPCIVDFSGGRDSSLVLAIAVHVARTHGLPPPVPYTRRFPKSAATEESIWQEMVISHLGLSDWEREVFSTELDLLGEPAQKFMRRYGLLLPSTLYVLTRSLDMAKGGSHLTGEGGDEVFRPSLLRAFLAYICSPKAVTQPRRTAAALQRVGPLAARRNAQLRRYRSGSPLPSAAWLLPEARREVERRTAEEQAKRPLGFASGLRWHLGQAVVRAHRHNLAILASERTTAHIDPLLDEAFVRSLAIAGGRLGFASRTEAMKLVAGDLLPPQVLERGTKATFNTAYFSEASRHFAATWAGPNPDPDLVDAAQVQLEWLKPVPSAASAAMLQAAWLEQQGASGLRNDKQA